MDKELCQDIIMVIDTLKTQSELKNSDGERMLGAARWSRARKWIGQNHGTAIVCFSDSIQKRRLPALEAMRSDCEKTLTQIHREEEDRELNNAYLKGQTDYAKKAFVISIIALIISMASVAATVLAATVWK